MSVTEHRTRVARLFRGKGTSGSGGLALPEVFREVLTTLLDDGPTPRLVLHKIIRDMFVYKSERVRDVWGSWEAFCDDLLYIMAEEGFLEEQEDSWALTGKAVPGTQLTIAKDPDNHGRMIRVTFASRKEQGMRDTLAIAWRQARDLARLLEPYRDQQPALTESHREALSITERLQRALSSPSGSLQPPVERAPGKTRRGAPRKARSKPEPPDEPEVMRTCIGVCERTLPQTRKHFECYWSRRDWYWRTDCRDCHARAKNTGSAKDQGVRAGRKEELRLRIAEVGEPFPSLWRFGQDLHMDAGSVRTMWQVLHAEGKAPPVPAPPPTYPRPPKNKH